jgi:hypothetical protein
MALPLDRIQCQSLGYRTPFRQHPHGHIQRFRYTFRNVLSHRRPGINRRKGTLYYTNATFQREGSLFIDSHRQRQNGRPCSSSLPSSTSWAWPSTLCSLLASCNRGPNLRRKWIRRQHRPSLGIRWTTNRDTQKPTLPPSTTRIMTTIRR